MKIFLLFLAVIFLNCSGKNFSSETNHKKNCKKYFVGNLNSDNINDTASVCQIGQQNFEIKFEKPIPRILLDQTSSVVIKQIEDINNDQVNEILIFSTTNEGWWNLLTVFTLQKNEWIEVGTAKAFISEDTDFENRIVNDNGIYFLIGDNQWEEDANGNFRKVRVKL